MAGNINIPANPSSSVSSSNSIASASVDGLVKSSTLTNKINKTPYDGKLDKNGEVRLRIGIIDNPVIKRSDQARIDPLNPYNIINMTTGQITVRWLEQDGGLVRPPEFGAYGQDGESSDREPLTLTHPMMWSNEDNWCGFHYMPPIGSVVVVGFRKHNLPVLLGFLQAHYPALNAIDLGELMLKGYGDNSSYWTMHSEQSHRSWVIKGAMKPVELLDDPGRKYRWEAAPYTVRLKLRLKAWIDPRNPDDDKELIEMFAIRESDSGTEQTYFQMRPEGLTVTSGNSDGETTFNVAPDNVSIIAGGTSVKATKDNISLNSAGSLDINASGAITLNGSSIDLN